MTESEFNMMFAFQSHGCWWRNGIMFCLEVSGGSAVVELVPSHHGSWVRIPTGVGLLYFPFLHQKSVLNRVPQRGASLLDICQVIASLAVKG